MEEKFNFFKRIKIAIFKLENYEKFINEKLNVAVRYFFILIFIVAVVISAISAFDFSKLFNKAYSYFLSDVPSFSVSDNKLSFENYVEGYDEEYDFRFIADTTENLSEETVTEYKNKVKNSGLILLNDKAIYIYSGYDNEYTYSELSSEYGLNITDKQGIIDKVNSIGKFGITFSVFIIFLLINFLVESISIFVDCIIIALFAWCVSKICKVRILFKHDFIISIYALTLPILLGILYNIANYFWGFQTELFRTVYLMISYVYVIAVILILKSDFINQANEIQKIEEVQKKVHEEMEQNEVEDNKKDNSDEENKLDDNEKKGQKDNNENNSDESDKPINNREPDGSEI